MEYVNSQQPVLACQKLFVLSHPGKGVEFGLSHPNQYFRESRQIITGVTNVKQEPGSQSGNIFTPKCLENNMFYCAIFNAVATPSTTFNSPASTYATPSPGRVQNSNLNSTPLSTKTPVRATPSHTTPASSRKALDVSNKKGKGADSNDVSDWLDEVDDLSQIEAMDTTN